jgi:broad specificity phosphatase PhoE
MTHRLTFLRHGQSVANREDRSFTGFPISALGRVPTGYAWGLEPLRYELIISSPLRRASETASILSDRLDLPIELEPQWVERDLGHAQGTRVQDFLGASRGARPSAVCGGV